MGDVPPFKIIGLARELVVKFGRFAVALRETTEFEFEDDSHAVWYSERT
jgi:hypothetical protein